MFPAAFYTIINFDPTVKPLMFVCPLFHKFRELNKTTKFKGANIDTIPIN